MDIAQTEATTLTEPLKTTKVTGSVALLEALIAEGTDTIFGYPGGAIMPIYDALYDYNEKLNHILVRHEQGGIHAGQGYARTSGKVGVVFRYQRPRCNKPGYRISRCADRQYTTGMYHRTSIRTSYWVQMLSRKLM